VVVAVAAAAAAVVVVGVLVGTLNIFEIYDKNIYSFV
jgi:hypothetical protein